jgi:hypothetical protein
VQELQAVQGLAADSRDLALGHHVESHDIGKTTTLHVFHHYPEVTAHKERIHKVDHVLVPAVSHHQNFVDDEVFLWLLFQVHLLNGDALISANLECGVNTTRSTLANLDQVAEFLCRISRIADYIQFANDLGICDGLPGSLPGPGRGTKRGRLRWCKLLWLLGNSWHLCLLLCLLLRIRWLSR